MIPATPHMVPLNILLWVLAGGLAPSSAAPPEPSFIPSVIADADSARQTSNEAASTSESPAVHVIMGSDSDLATMRAAAEVLEDFGVPCHVTVVSAHRTPQRMLDFAQNAHKHGVKVTPTPPLCPFFFLCLLVQSCLLQPRCSKIAGLLGGLHGPCNQHRARHTGFSST